ncbi:MAG: acetyl-CoA hydrolase/transferase C-terminal domain-containing protein [Syntrophales bacterium]|nr:acetyl-CoA hydrolase/transferase C-terminal domain-containing protein [Syntrophales bacterium]
MSLIQEYRSKCVTAEKAVQVIKSGDWVDFNSFNGTVRCLDRALAKRKDELKDIKIWTCVTSYKSAVMEADPKSETFTWHSWHMSGQDRKLADSGTPVYYSPIRYSEVPRYVRQEIDPLAVAMLQVAPMDKHGYFNFGLQNSHSKAACDRAKIVIVEVNEKMPRCLGGYDEAIHVSEVDYIVETDNEPIVQAPAGPITDVDKKVAELIVEDMCDGSVVQLGIGGMPNAVGMLIAQSDLRDLGCHTEMLVDAYVHMFNAGKMTGARKSIEPGKIVYTFALGTQILYDFVDDNPRCASYPVDYTNDPFIASKNDNLMSINNAIEVDLYGQVCAESAGIRQISGTGGQLDFVMAAYLSKGGKSFVCLPSSFKTKDGRTKSRIVPTLQVGGIVTDPRSVAHIIVTEYGKFNLKGKSTWQRAEGLIGIAHPDTREDLIRAAEDQKIWRQSNKIA